MFVPASENIKVSIAIQIAQVECLGSKIRELLAKCRKVPLSIVQMDFQRCGAPWPVPFHLGSDIHITVAIQVGQEYPAGIAIPQTLAAVHEQTRLATG